jgi:hypothetical protein
MPNEKIIPKLYKRNYSTLGLYFFVSGQRSIVPAITIEKAIYNYFRFIGEDNFNIESSMSTFTQLQKEFHESSKTDK